MLYLAQFAFYGVPAAALLFFLVSLFRYVRARRSDREQPGSVGPDEMKKLKSLLIAASAIAGVLAAIVIAIAALLLLAVSFM